MECPLGQRKEFCWHGFLARHALLADLVLHDLDHTSAGDGEVFGVKLLLILFDSEIVRAELTGLDLASVAVEELDGHSDTMLGEEGDGVGAGLDAILHVPDRLTLLDEVGFGELLHLVVIGVFLRSDQLVELVILELFAWLGARLDLVVLLVVVVVHLVHLHLHVHAVADLVTVHVVHGLLLHSAVTLSATAFLNRWQFRGVSDTRSHSAATKAGHDGERVLSKLNISVEVVQTLVVGSVLAAGLGCGQGEHVRIVGARFLGPVLHLLV